MPQSLAKTSVELYRSKKSDILSVFTRCDMLLKGPPAAIELYPSVKTHDLTNCGTFLDLALALYSRISKIAARCIRIDVVTDRYFNNSLKEGTPGTRGSEGTTFGDIKNHDEIPSNFKKDLHNTHIKDSLIFILLLHKYMYLLTKDLSDKDINSYKYEEAGVRAIKDSIRVSKC